MKQFFLTIAWHHFSLPRTPLIGIASKVFSKAGLNAHAFRMLAMTMDALTPFWINTALLAQVNEKEVWRKLKGTQASRAQGPHDQKIDLSEILHDLADALGKCEKPVKIDLWMENDTVYLLWILRLTVTEQTNGLVSVEVDAEAVVQHPLRSARKEEYVQELQRAFNFWVRSAEHQASTVVREMRTTLNKAFGRNGNFHTPRSIITAPKLWPFELRKLARKAAPAFTKGKIYPRSYQPLIEIDSSRDDFYLQWFEWFLLADSKEVGEAENTYVNQEGVELPENELARYFRECEELASSKTAPFVINDEVELEKMTEEAPITVEPEHKEEKKGSDVAETEEAAVDGDDATDVDDDKYAGEDEKYSGGEDIHHDPDWDDKYSGGHEEDRVPNDEEDENGDNDSDDNDNDDDDDGDDGDDGGDD